MKRWSILIILMYFGAGCATQRGTHAGVQLPKTLRIDRIVIDKSEGTMEVYARGELLKTYSVAVGKGGSGPKRMRGDNRTPEGRYRIDSRHHSQKFHRFLHVSYPNTSDRAAFDRGRKDGSLPKAAAIGGNIGIHGEKRGREWMPHKLVDWTQGCIAVDNDEIEELYRAVKDGALVDIEP